MSIGPKTGLGAGGEAREGAPPLHFEAGLIAAFTAAAIATTASITAASAHAVTGASGGAAVLQALARGTIVGVPLAVAWYAIQRPAHARFGRLLLLVSTLWWVASLSSSSSSLLFSIGRIGGWLAETGLVYTLLAFPAGRLTARVDRWLMAISVAVVALLYLPTALLVQRYPAPGLWGSCYAACPHNAFAVISGQPAFIDDVVGPVRDALVAVVFVIVAGRLAVRLRGANSLMRRTLAPVLVVAIARLIAFAAVLVARRVSPDSTLTQVAIWLVAFAFPAIALGFLVGLLRWHLFVTAGIQTVNARLRGMPGPVQVQELLAGAFDDPELEIASWTRDPACWMSASGHVIEEPEPDSGRCLTEIREEQRRVVAIMHDVALRDDSAFIEAAAAASSVAFATDRAAVRTGRMVRELKESRARILAAADGERRRIERDLHDGAQQRLVALCIHLELAAESVDREHPQEAAALRELVGEVDQALEEMRSLTHGIYPAVLLDRGLAEALRSAARRSPVPATVRADELGNYPDELVAAVYFCCIEALQNVAKHAAGASSARIVLRETDSVLRFSVSDDGPGMDDVDAVIGAGMMNMHDRMTTLGGELRVESRPGHGTHVIGKVPIAAAAGGHTGDGSQVLPA